MKSILFSENDLAEDARVVRSNSERKRESRKTNIAKSSSFNLSPILISTLDKIIFQNCGYQDREEKPANLFGILYKPLINRIIFTLQCYFIKVRRILANINSSFIVLIRNFF